MSIPAVSPQPLGALPWPAGLLLLPAGSDTVAAALVCGDDVDAWTPETEFMRLALDDQPNAAATHVTGDDLVAQYNRAVLLGGDGVWEALAATADGDLLTLVDTARFSIGQLDSPPDAKAERKEVQAMALSARASAALERGDVPSAVDDLEAAAANAQAAGSPVFAATLRLTQVELLREQVGDAARAAAIADRAVQDLPLAAPRELRAELQVARALSRQQVAGTDKGALLAVVADLTEAVKIFREETHPEMFGLINQHLALAYLVMPMNDEADRIRLGVAVNSLRAALRVFTPQTNPAQWATTQLNLANALQYLPSVHQEANLDEAVQLYEELLQYRDPEHDPLGFARILANQGNALGHLGVFADARARLERAQSLFEQCGDTDSALSVAEVLTSLAAAEDQAD